MNKVDWSYLKYSEHSYGRVMGRRREVWKLASRIYEFSLDSRVTPLKQMMYSNAYILLTMGESDRVTCNNWRKIHGIPLLRRMRNHGKSKT